MSVLRRERFTAQGRAAVVTVMLVVGSDWTADPSNFWTLSLRRVNAQFPLGQTIASYSLGVRSLTAGTQVVVFDSTRSGLFRLEDGDRLVQYAESTGSPVTPTDAVFQVRVQGG